MLVLGETRWSVRLIKRLIDFKASRARLTYKVPFWCWIGCGWTVVVERWWTRSLLRCLDIIEGFFFECRRQFVNLAWSVEDGEVVLVYMLACGCLHRLSRWHYEIQEQHILHTPCISDKCAFTFTSYRDF